MQFGRGCNAVLLRHDEIHDDDVRLELERPRDGLLAVAGFADDFETVLSAEKRRQPHAHDGMVVGNQNPDLIHGVIIARLRFASLFPRTGDGQCHGHFCALAACAFDLHFTVESFESFGNALKTEVAL